MAKETTEVHFTNHVNMTGLDDTVAADQIVGYKSETGDLVPIAIGPGIEVVDNTIRAKSYLLHTNTTEVGNVGSGEDDLMTYPVPAGKLESNGDIIEFTMSISLAPNTDSKTTRVYFGSAIICQIPGVAVGAGGNIEITGTIIRKGATTQKVTASYRSSIAGFEANSFYTETAQTLANSLTLKATGEGINNNDIIQNLVTVKYISNA